MQYYRPIVQIDRCRPKGAYALAGGWSWFTHVECLGRDGSVPDIVSASEIPKNAIKNLTQPRMPICGLEMSEPHIMAVLNVTPDSFSDGGKYNSFDGALARAKDMVAQGASILDIGGESTRPGADYVDIESEVARTTPVIKTLISDGVTTPISIDTRKASVAQSALDAGAMMFNDVTALRHDSKSLSLAAEQRPYICLMHSLDDPKKMQNDPSYESVLLDIYDHLERQIMVCLDAGVAKDRIVIDPGIGFGKTQDHNLQLIRGISLFHGLGCPVLLGVSRKRFIGDIGFAQEAADRMAGSIALALEGLRQGVQILRVHDIWQTKQAMRLWQATL